jgi:hypothetical protein
MDYQPGKSQRIFMTGRLGSVVANTSAKIGYFNQNDIVQTNQNYDGICFARDTAIKCEVWNTGTAVKSVAQSSWNIDKMDGTGKSGITVNWAYDQIFVMDFLWLGSDRVRWGLKIGGKIYYVHEESFANTAQTGAYMASPNHSIRYELLSTGGSSSIRAQCCSVQSEGGVQPSGVSIAFDQGITGAVGVASNANAALIGIRQKDTSLHTTVIPELVSVLASTSTNFLWELLLNPSVAGTVTWNNASESGLQWASGAVTNTVTGGRKLASGYGASTLNSVSLPVETVLRPGSKIDGTRDTLWLVVTNLGVGSESFLGAVTVNELYCGG